MDDRNTFQQDVIAVIQDEHVDVHRLAVAVITAHVDAGGPCRLDGFDDVGVHTAHFLEHVSGQAVERPAAGYGDVFSTAGIDQRPRAPLEVVPILAQKDRRSGLEVERHIVLKDNRAGGILSRRNVYGAAATGYAGFYRIPEGLRGIVFPLSSGPVIRNVKDRASTYSPGS